MQTKDELEDWYGLKPDPWAYMSTSDDEIRKRYIIHTATLFGSFCRALDVGAGEGWITQSLPAIEKHGYELSDTAASRFPLGIKRELSGQYDLVIATGVLYAHYDWQHFVDLIKNHASRIILTCNIKQWETPHAIAQIPGKQLLDTEFPYREFTQKLRVFGL